MEEKDNKGFIFRDRRKIRLEYEGSDHSSPLNDEKQEEAEKEYREAADNQEKSQEGFLPKVNFSTFVFSLASSALVHLGEVKDPVTGKVETNLQLARQIIDTLAMLEEKTKGNLDEAEENLLGSLLYDLRIKFVQKTK